MTNNKEEEKEKIHYKAYSFRLHEETYKKLCNGRNKENLSWNRYLVKLLDNKKQNEN